MRWTERGSGRKRDGRQGERRGERGEGVRGKEFSFRINISQGNIDTNQLLSFSRSAFNGLLNKHKHSQHDTSCLTGEDSFKSVSFCLRRSSAFCESWSLFSIQRSMSLESVDTVRRFMMVSVI